MARYRAVLLASAAVGLCLAGCVEPPAAQVWAASDMVHLTAGMPPARRDAAWDGQARTVRLFAAGNETVSFQLVVDAPPGGLREVDVSIPPPATRTGAALPPGCVRLFRMLGVEITRYPAWYVRLADGPVRPERFYDALVPIDAPRGGGPFDLAAGERLALWVDVRVPGDAPPGQFHAPITVTSKDRQQHLTLSLEVLDLALPVARPVACLGGFSHEAVFRWFVRRPAGADGRTVPYRPARLDGANPDVRAGLLVVRQLMRLAHQHRVDLFDKDLRPLLKRDAAGKVALRWDDYDWIVRPYLNGRAFEDRIGVPAWPAPLSARWPDPKHYGGVDSPAWRATASAVVKQTASHFRTLGAGERLFFWPRTAGGAGGYARHVGLARACRAAAGKLPILSELPPTPPPETGWTVPAEFAGLADMFAPPAHLVALSQAAGLARTGRPLAGLWLRTGRPPYIGSCGVLAAPADVRALPWLAQKYRCAGIFLPEVLHWQADPRRSAGESQDRLFYPGTPFGLDVVLPSVRLKRLRRGLQDAAYLWLLRRHERGAVADVLTNTLVRYAALDAVGDHYHDPRLDGWVRDGEPWIMARRLLGREALAAVHPKAVTRRQQLADRLAWGLLHRRTCRVRVERVRCHVEPRPGGRFRAAVRVEVFNELLRPVDVELAVAALPAGFRAVEPAVALKGLGGGKRAVIRLAAEGGALPTSPAGKLRIALKLTPDGDADKRQDLTVDVPVLLAGWSDRKLTVDGDLHDWPLRSGNAAGAFRLLGRRGRTGSGLARQQTTVFALYNDENLYLAFRCQDADPRRAKALPNNIIRYEQLLAAGEDLVEVIADPTGSARHAEGLYHLAVKANGVLLTERGVQTDPPLGRSGPWPVAAKVAVRTEPRLRVVELAIPLAAFGDPAKAAGAFWRINFTRFATADNEASSWAGPARYFYHPDNLGTMYLVPKGRQVRFPTAPKTRDRTPDSSPQGD